MAFFFSAISAQKSPKSKGKKQAGAPEPEGDDSNDEVLTSQVASNTSPEWLSHHATVVDEKLRPTINYWIALTTPNGAPANPIFIHRALLDCDVETMANQVQYLSCSLLGMYEDLCLLANITDEFSMHGPVLLDHKYIETPEIPLKTSKV